MTFIHLFLLSNCSSSAILTSSGESRYPCLVPTPAFWVALLLITPCPHFSEFWGMDGTITSFSSLCWPQKCTQVSFSRSWLFCNEKTFLYYLVCCCWKQHKMTLWKTLTLKIVNEFSWWLNGSHSISTRIMKTSCVITTET